MTKETKDAVITIRTTHKRKMMVEALAEDEGRTTSNYLDRLIDNDQEKKNLNSEK